ncbi:hypothetical protein, partial [Marinospirillum sp.]|uniref:hypothetical protein n=1 Tax=Marinospirillum sp. TaxID=2183934 RepID=UPI0025C2CAAE
QMMLKEWICWDKTLQHLDIWDAPQLERLDLSRCQPGMHLMLVNCPQLKEVILPATGASNLHLDHPAPPQIRFVGSIEAIDGCWPGQQFRLEAHADDTWSEVCILSGEQFTQAHQRDDAIGTAEAVIVHGPSCVSELILDLQHVQYLSWFGATGLQSLEVPKNEDAIYMTLLQLVDATDLKQVKLIRLLSEAELRGCHSLEHFDCLHGKLTIHESEGQQELVIIGNYKLILNRIKTTSVKSIDSIFVEINFCRNLDNVELGEISYINCQGKVPANLRSRAQVVVNEATVKAMAEDYRQGDNSVLSDLQFQISCMATDKQVPQALWLLRQMQQDGAPADWIWQTRLQLSARHLRSNRKRRVIQMGEPLEDQHLMNARQQWRWQLPDDLGENAWQYDWDLWKGCLTLAEARDYTSVIITWLIGDDKIDRIEGRPMPIYQWLRHWLNSGDLQLPIVQKIVRKLLKSMTKKQKKTRYSYHRNEQELSAQLLSQISSQLQDATEETEALKRVLLDYECRMLSISELLKRMQQLMQDNPLVARRQLIHLAAQPADYWENRGSTAEIASLPRQARALALSGRLPQAAQTSIQEALP